MTFLRLFVADGAVLPPPTTEWQDRLAGRLDASRASLVATLGHDLARSKSDSHNSPGTRSTSDASDHLPQRRRLDADFLGFGVDQPNWDAMYTMDASSGDDRGTDDGCAAFGQLSLDEHREVSFILVYAKHDCVNI